MGTFAGFSFATKMADSGSSEPIYQTSIERNVKMEARDGTTLVSDIFRPVPRTLNETFPVLVVRLPYNKDFESMATHQTYDYYEVLG